MVKTLAYPTPRKISPSFHPVVMEEFPYQRFLNFKGTGSRDKIHFFEKMSSSGSD
jgi:hypothetical protein